MNEEIDRGFTNSLVCMKCDHMFCDHMFWHTTPGQWQSRPLEQKLRAENDELKKINKNLIANKDVIKIWNDLEVTCAEDLVRRNDELKKQVDGLRCCENCQNDSDIPPFCDAEQCHMPGLEGWKPKKEGVKNDKKK